MKELLRKKYIKILLSLITLLVVIGIVGINVRSSQKDRDYKAHIAAAEKYLSDLDYEQAIAEYTKALEIDPKEEVVDALAQAYLDYAKSYADTGDYERAVSILEESYEKINPKEEIVDALEQIYLAYTQTYIEAEDYDKAVSILKEKSEKTGWESLQNMIVEVTALQEEKRLEEEKRASNMVKFPFRLADITVMGYDLYEDHLAQIQEPFPIDWVYEDGSGGAGATPDGKSYRIETNYSDWGEMKWLTVDAENNMGNWRYGVAYGTNGTISRSLFLSTYSESDVFNDPLISVPVTAGESYEDWCRVMQVERIKKNDLQPEIRDGEVGIWGERGSLTVGNPQEGAEYWHFYTEEYEGIYEEHSYAGGNIECSFHFLRTNPKVGEEQFPSRISASIADGAIFSIGYQDSHKW